MIENTRNAGGNNFAWWNLQCYGRADYAVWVSALKNANTRLGPNAIEAFVVPGFEPFCNSTPAGELESLRRQFPHLNGAFISNYSEIKDCAAQQAAAIRNAF